MTAKAQRRVDRELKTVRAMIHLYCRGNHGAESEPCEVCRALWKYAEERVERCPFRADKPTCLHCTVHCYKREMRESIRVVMRYSGPRMIWRHPILALLHSLDGRRRRATSFASRTPPTRKAS
jgi:hypothetical protein